MAKAGITVVSIFLLGPVLLGCNRDPDSLGRVTTSAERQALRAAEPPPPPPVKPEPPPVPIPVKVATLIADYKANEIAADQKWKGKRVRVVGIVRSVEKMMGDPVITIGTRWERVRCWFPKDTTAPLENIAKDGSIILDGRCDGAGPMGGVVLRECEWPFLEKVKAETPQAVKWAQ